MQLVSLPYFCYGYSITFYIDFCIILECAWWQQEKNAASIEAAIHAYETSPTMREEVQRAVDSAEKFHVDDSDLLNKLLLVVAGHHLQVCPVFVFKQKKPLT